MDNLRGKQEHIQITVSYTQKNRIGVVMFNATFSNISVISWWSDLLFEDTGAPRENHQPDDTSR